MTRPIILDVVDWLDSLCKEWGFPTVYLDFTETNNCIGVVQTSSTNTVKTFINGKSRKVTKFDIVYNGMMEDKVDIISNITSICVYLDNLKCPFFISERKVLKVSVTVPAIRKVTEGQRVQYGTSVTFEYEEG